MGQIIVETKFAEGDHVQWQQRTRTDKICGECGSHFEEKGVETFAGTVVKYQVLIALTLMVLTPWIIWKGNQG